MISLPFAIRFACCWGTLSLLVLKARLLGLLTCHVFSAAFFAPLLARSSLPAFLVRRFAAVFACPIAKSSLAPSSRAFLAHLLCLLSRHTFSDALFACHLRASSQILCCLLAFFARLLRLLSLGALLLAQHHICNQAFKALPAKKYSRARSAPKDCACHEPLNLRKNANSKHSHILRLSQDAAAIWQTTTEDGQAASKPLR